MSGWSAVVEATEMTGSWPRFVGGSMAMLLLLSIPVLAQKETARTTFEVFQDAKKEWRWRYKAANNLVLATPGEGYKAKADAMKAIDSLKDHIDKMKVEFFEDSKKEYRWRLKATNGNIMAVSSEGYKNKADAERGLELLKKGAKSAKVMEKTEAKE